MSEREQFNAAYWESFPPEVKALGGLAPFSDERMERAITLSTKGYSIDGEIQARGMSPWETMMLRKNYGYTWIPSLLQDPIVIAPGLEVPGVAPYNPNKPPAGSIRVSASVADYPPFSITPPAIEASVPAKPWFEVPQGAGRFSVRPGDNSPAGTIYAGDEGKFAKVLIASPFGFWKYWEVAK